MTVAIVTGHSRGLGAAIAENLLLRGIPVLALARHGNDGLAADFAGLLHEVRLDLSDSAALARWLEGEALPAFLAEQRCVLLINNAGMLQPVGPLAGQAPAAVARTVALNVAAPLMLAAALVAASPAAADRRILHVSSGAARSAYPGWSVYCATKAALDHHARSVALDGTPGLRIGSVAPGVIDTGMQGEIRASRIEDFPLQPRFEALLREGQLSSPRDCAERLVDCLLAPGFGDAPTGDLRDTAR